MFNLLGLNERNNTLKFALAKDPCENWRWQRLVDIASSPCEPPHVPGCVHLSSLDKPSKSLCRSLSLFVAVIDAIWHHGQLSIRLLQRKGSRRRSDLGWGVRYANHRQYYRASWSGTESRPTISVKWYNFGGKRCSYSFFLQSL